MDQPHADIANFYDGRHIFYTGATGMLGMAFLSRIVLDTPVSCIYALVRGGESRFWKELDSHLPSDLVQALQKSNKLVIWEGDMTLPNFGLETDEVETLRRNVSIFIHGASTLNLKRDLKYVAESIIKPSLAMAKLGLSCPNLTRFVFVSTAYSSAFLRRSSDGQVSGQDALIKEEVIPIRSSSAFENLEAELSDLETFGSTPEFAFVQHPYSYSYAKHLTERLLLREFEAHGQVDKLTILRPSAIGPAVSKPFPFFERPGSTPVTTIMAMIVINPPTAMRFASHLADPSTSTFDEVPVDLVVNTMIVHCAVGTSGIIHAVAGKEGSAMFHNTWPNVISLRRSWWGRPRAQWVKTDWKAPNLCALAKLFVLMGCSFIFDQARTHLVWERMSEAERRDWPLWVTTNSESRENVEGREKSIKIILGYILTKKYRLPAFMVGLICRSVY
ncbi:Putative fatty acyl-CoA reductase [Cladobotryum mycophilum]|uniref:Fatty acyl-CoA reductase n=1 Tax=Cladobotryum mycophilum TaxID=491253 RepID=A0ABR0SPF6_9HYPO